MGMEPSRHRSSHPWVSASQGSALRIFSLASSLLSGTRVRDGQVGRDPRVWSANSRSGEALSPRSTFCQRPAVTRRSPSRQRLGGRDTISISSQTSGIPLSRKVFSTGQRSSCGPSWLVTLGRPWVWAPGGYPICPWPPLRHSGPPAGPPTWSPPGAPAARLQASLGPGGSPVYWPVLPPAWPCLPLGL